VIEDAQFVNPSAIAARLQHQSSSPMLRRLASLICPLPKIEDELSPNLGDGRDQAAGA
jgi:hypothetical protein